MRFSNSNASKPRTSSGIFLKKMPPMIVLAKRSKLEEPL
jgi:hypothetical protein